jgi:hypothetical protein
VREAPQAERLRDELQVLEHEPLLDPGELHDVALEVEDGADHQRVRIVVEMPALRLAERLEPRWPVAVALVVEHVAELLAQDQEEDGQGKRGHLGHEDEVGRAGHVRRPPVEGRHEQRIAGHRRTLVGDPHPHQLVEVGELPPLCELDQAGNLVFRERLRAPQVERTVVVEDERDHGVHAVGARDRPRDRVHHDVAVPGLRLLAFAVRELA